MRLAEAAAFGNEPVWRLGVELEQVEVTGDNAAGADRLGEACCLRPIEIAGDPPFGPITIDWEKRDINGEIFE